jgi:signal peptidase I
MPPLSERLANIGLPYVILTVVALYLIRAVLIRRRTPLAKSTAEIAESLMIAIALVFLVIKPFLVQSFYIPSESMVPTLEDDDRILVNKLVYRYENPQRGDIVVFKAPMEATHGQDKDFIKRLIGFPGDILRIKVLGTDPQNGLPYGDLVRNGKVLDEQYLEEPHHVECLPAARINLVKPYKVPPGTVFMMGDNRNNSDDSRFWGALDRSRIIGKAEWRFWPMNRIGILR